MSIRSRVVCLGLKGNIVNSSSVIAIIQPFIYLFMLARNFPAGNSPRLERIVVLQQNKKLSYRRETALQPV